LRRGINFWRNLDLCCKRYLTLRVFGWLYYLGGWFDRGRINSRYSKIIFNFNHLGSFCNYGNWLMISFKYYVILSFFNLDNRSRRCFLTCFCWWRRSLPFFYIIIFGKLLRWSLCQGIYCSSNDTVLIDYFWYKCELRMYCYLLTSCNNNYESEQKRRSKHIQNIITSFSIIKLDVD